MKQTSSFNPQQHAQPQQQLHTFLQLYVLALDIGTSSVRALLYDATGTAVTHVHAQQTYDVTTSGDGEVTVDADMLVDLVATTIDEVLAAAGPLASHIRAVATDTFWHSFLAVDASGHPLMPLVTWEDTRSRGAATELLSHSFCAFAQIGHEQRRHRHGVDHDVILSSMSSLSRCMP